MRTRPRLITSIPFWVLIAGSLAVIGAGLWNVFRGVDAMGLVLTNPNATVVEVYVAQTWAFVGGGLTAAGIVGLFIALALAAASAFVPRADVATGQDSADEATLPFPSSNVARTTPAAVASTGSVDDSSTPVALEDPDVETSSNTPAPPQAAAAARADAAEDPARN